MFFTGGMHAQAQAGHKLNTKQIDSLLKEKNSRTPAERKIDSQLLQAIKKYAAHNTNEKAGKEAVGIHPAQDGTILVDISTAVTDDLLNMIKKQGGEVMYASKQYSSVRARVPVAAVKQIAALEQVTFITAASVPVLSTGTISGKASQ